MYNRDEATNPIHTIESATLLTNGNSNSDAKPYIKADKEPIPII